MRSLGLVARCAALAGAGVSAGWLFQACTNGPRSSAAPSSTASTAATVMSVTVSGSAPTAGASAQFSATAVFSDGTTQSVTDAAAWSSSNSAVAGVTASGLVTAIAAGDADITATYRTISGKLRVTIARPAFTISGTLHDGTSGGVLPRVVVQAVDSSGTTRSTTTDAAGAYAISGVAPGTVTLTITAASYIPMVQTANVSADTRVDLVLTRVVSVNLAGTWAGSGSDGLGPETFTWVVTQSGDTLSGSASMRGPADGSCGSCHKFKDGSISGSVSGTTVTLRMSFALGGSQPTPTCLVTMDVTASDVTTTHLSSSYDGSDSCEPAVARGSITMTRQ